VHAARRSEPQRRAFTFVDGERKCTITAVGEQVVSRGADPLPWHELAEMDAVYFMGGTDALQAEGPRTGDLDPPPRAFAGQLRLA